MTGEPRDRSDASGDVLLVDIPEHLEYLRRLHATAPPDEQAEIERKATTLRGWYDLLRAEPPAVEFVEFTSDHHVVGRRYRVTSAGPLHVEYLHPRQGWREVVNANTREIARRVRDGVQS